MSLEHLQAIALAATQKTADARAKRIAKGGPEAWRKTWEDGLRTHYPENVLSYTDRAANNIKQAIRKRGLDPDDMCNFFGWIVANWTLLRQTVFSYNPREPKGPPTPDMGAVVVHLVQVHATYMQSKPAIQAAIPLAARAGLTVRPRPTAAKPVAKPVSAPRAAPPKAPPRPTINHDAARTEAARQRLNLPKWDD